MARRLGTGDDLRVVLATRGYGRVISELNPRENGSFDRTLDRTGTCTLTIPVSGSLGESCCDDLEELAEWATEIVVFRDTDEATGLKRDAFGGPVVDIDWKYGEVKIIAKGLTAWWSRRLLPRSSPGLLDAAEYFNLYHSQAMAADPITGFDVNATPTGIQIERDITDEITFASEPLKELSDSTIDWTEYGRKLIVGGGEVPAEPYVTLSDRDFTKPLEVKSRGSVMATQVVAIGNGVIGVADDAAAQAYYGLITRTIKAEFISDPNEIQQFAQTKLDLLKRSTYIAPPKNATLKPTAPITLPELIPGMRIRFDASATCQGLVEDFRLHRVKVGFDGKVSIECQPLGTLV